MSILSLPPEIFDQILECISTQSERQQTTLQLTRALPRAPIPLYHLFEVVTLREAAQIVGLHRRIRSSSGDGDAAVEGRDEDVDEERSEVGDGCSSMIHVLHIDSFDADAEVVLNLLALVDDVEHLRLCVGALFMPEHLQAALSMPRRALRRLEVRFRPYVRKANYLPFLKGSYYDAALSELARWPAPSPLASPDDVSHVGLQSLSLIQEPLPSTSLHTESEDSDNVLAMTKGKFAQPIVFFSFHPLAELLASPAMSTLRSLTVRIPGRDITPHLFTASSVLSSLSASSAARTIKRLDLSTTSVSLRALERLLVRVPKLTHLVLDETNVIPKGEPLAVEESWKALGKVCAAAGAAESKEVEKEVGEWLAAAQEDALGGGEHDDGGDANGGRNGDNANVGGRVQRRAMQKKGRRGVAISTISLRGVSSSSSSASTSLDGGRPPLNLSSFTISSISASSLLSNNKTKIRIVPPPPTLPRTPSSHHHVADGQMSNDPSNHEDEEESARRLFKDGWDEGIAQMRVRWGRLRASVSSSLVTSASPPSATRSTPSTMVLAFRDGEREELIPATTEDLERLSEVEFTCPEICFAKDGRDGGEKRTDHVEGCGHWIDEGDGAQAGCSRRR